MSPEKYVQQTVADVETELEKIDQILLSTRVTTPVSQGYRPELDQSRELDAKRGQYYQSLIVVLRWVCELGRIDVLAAVSMLSRCVVSPLVRGTCNRCFISSRTCSTTRDRKWSSMTQSRYSNESSFKICDWSEFYPDAEEVIPPDCPKEHRNGVVTSCFVDADHAGCKATRRSHGGNTTAINTIIEYC
jgi:hypothetical protein